MFFGVCYCLTLFFDFFTLSCALVCFDAESASIVSNRGHRSWRDLDSSWRKFENLYRFNRQNARRLRVDYRRLGRAAASQLLHGTPVTPTGLSGHQFLRHFRHDATA
jgi:hypothetical protein